jgi:hypothetical protein
MTVVVSALLLVAGLVGGRFDPSHHAVEPLIAGESR